MESHDPVWVNKPFLPPQEEYFQYLRYVWDSKQLTNGGQLLFKLKAQLESYLKVPHLLPTANGTLSLQLAIKALNLKGEIITTPFSYIATSSAIVWQNCTPVFADIEPDHWCIDPSKIEELVTKNTSAILATHVFGNPCNVEALDLIAKKYGLKIIYDGAHCFGVKYNDTSIFNYGDLSVCSFHATKLFHTGEGGCVITKDLAKFDKLVWLHNLGHDGQENFHGVGINGKMNELQAAMGLSVLPHIEYIIQQRSERVNIYNELFGSSEIQRIKIRKNTKWNGAYYPVLFRNNETMLKIKKDLNDAQIFPRRYFYPSLNTLEFFNNKSMSISEDIASRILCLPLYHDLLRSDIEKISEIIMKRL